MPNVKVRENEPFEFALRRFKRTVEKTGLLTEQESVSVQTSTDPAPLQAGQMEQRVG